MCSAVGFPGLPEGTVGASRSTDWFLVRLALNMAPHITVCLGSLFPCKGWEKCGMLSSPAKVGEVGT